MLEREVVIRGPWWRRALDTVVHFARGRRIVDCSRCFGCGISRVERIDWRPEVPISEAQCVLTVCTKCAGVGALWR